jgi:hypothetical protein
MVDEDARRCIADLCSTLEVVIKVLLEIGPTAAAIPTTLSQYDESLAERLVVNTQSLSGLGGFVALRDGLNLIGRVKREYGL